MLRCQFVVTPKQPGAELLHCKCLLFFFLAASCRLMNKNNESELKTRENIVVGRRSRREIRRAAGAGKFSRSFQPTFAFLEFGCKAGLGCWAEAMLCLSLFLPICLPTSYSLEAPQNLKQTTWLNDWEKLQKVSKKMAFLFVLSPSWHWESLVNRADDDRHKSPVREHPHRTSLVSGLGAFGFLNSTLTLPSQATHFLSALRQRRSVRGTLWASSLPASICLLLFSLFPTFFSFCTITLFSTENSHLAKSPYQSRTAFWWFLLLWL